MLLNAYELTGPTEDPSTFTSAIVYPVVAVMVKVWPLPPLTLTGPDGEIDPPEPAEAVIE
jgi:hypothetical protein